MDGCIVRATECVYTGMCSVCTMHCSARYIVDTILIRFHSTLHNSARTLVMYIERHHITSIGLRLVCATRHKRNERNPNDEKKNPPKKIKIIYLKNNVRIIMVRAEVENGRECGHADGRYGGVW